MQIVASKPESNFSIVDNAQIGACMAAILEVVRNQTFCIGWEESLIFIMFDSFWSKCIIDEAIQCLADASLIVTYTLRGRFESQNKPMIRLADTAPALCA